MGESADAEPADREDGLTTLFYIRDLSGCGLGIRGESWNKSPVDTEARLYFTNKKTVDQRGGFIFQANEW